MNSTHRLMMKTSAAVLLAVAVGALGIPNVNQAKGRGVEPLASGKEPSHIKTAEVQVAPIRKGTVEQSIVAYGSVIPAPGKSKVLSIPFAIQVLSVCVTEGQEVHKGDELLKIGPSPDEKLALQKAMIRVQASKKRLKVVRERFALKLATVDELSQAEQAFEEAKADIESLKNKKMAETIVIFSESNSVISKLFKAKGEIVPAGIPVMEIVSNGEVEVRLGIEPEDAGLIKPGSRVSLTAVNRPALPAVTGKVRAVSRRVNPATRLLDVFVTTASPPVLMLNEYIKARVSTASRKALLVPRPAVLPEGDHFILFTINDGRARKHIVNVGTATDSEVEVSGGDISPGDQVVVLGNYELADGMSVRMRGH